VPIRSACTKCTELKSKEATVASFIEESMFM